MAIARPIPCPDPVTTATFPFNTSLTIGPSFLVLAFLLFIL
jgi:hypothetical protein